VDGSLFFTAWILSSLPSQALRLCHKDPDVATTENDVYEASLYMWLQKKRRVPKMRLGFMMSLQHWLWRTGLLLAAVLFLVHLFGHH
jgi:hypothetical protein